MTSRASISQGSTILGRISYSELRQKEKQPVFRQIFQMLICSELNWIMMESISAKSQELYLDSWSALQSSEGWCAEKVCTPERKGGTNE